MEPESAENQVGSGDTQRLLIDVAIRHLSLYGWEGTQLPAIVDEVHVAKSSVYHFFGSREGLLAAATAALSRDELATDVASAQQVFVDAMAEIICDAQQRGLINSTVNPTSYASWLHGMTLGRTLTESSCSDPLNWLAVAVPAAPRKLTAATSRCLWSS